MHGGPLRIDDHPLSTPFGENMSSNFNLHVKQTPQKEALFFLWTFAIEHVAKQE